MYTFPVFYVFYTVDMNYIYNIKDKGCYFKQHNVLKIN